MLQVLRFLDILNHFFKDNKTEHILQGLNGRLFGETSVSFSDGRFFDCVPRSRMLISWKYKRVQIKFPSCPISTWENFKAISLCSTKNLHGDVFTKTRVFAIKKRCYVRQNFCAPNWLKKLQYDNSFCRFFAIVLIDSWKFFFQFFQI